MIYIKGFMIRHQKSGMLTDRVYLTPPPRAEFDARVAELGEGWAKVVETTIALPDSMASFAGQFEKVPDPVPVAQPAAAGSKVSSSVIGELTTQATGVVTPPKKR
jgi:hypothetical protein